MVDDQVVYVQALETVRSTTNQVVSTGGRFYPRAQWKVNAPLLVALITLAAAGVAAATVDSWSAAGNPT
jgi:hypothetical protein